MAEVDGSPPNSITLSPGSPSDGSIGPSTKIEDLRQLLLDVSNQILGKLGQLKKEVQAILNSDHMQDKKIYCDTMVEVAKKLEGFPYGSKGYQPGKVPDECAYPNLITFHNNMDLLIWETCSKISIIEDFIQVSPSMNKMVVVGVTLQDVRKILSSLPLPPLDLELDLDLDPPVPNSPRSKSEGFPEDPTSPFSPPSSPSKAGITRKDTALMLRSATGSVRGTKSQLIKEMEKVDDVINQRSQTLRSSQPSELFIEMMTEKASLIESNPLEFREKLLGMRRKGARHNSVDGGGDTAAEAARKQKNRHNSDPPHLIGQNTQQAEKGGFHLLSLFIPPGRSSGSNSGQATPTEADGDKSPFLSRTRRQTGGFKMPSPELIEVPPLDLTEPSHRLIANVRGFRLDNGQPFIAHPPQGKQLVFLDSDKDIASYALTFFSVDHFNYLGHDKHSAGPAAVSAILKQVSPATASKTTFDALILIRTPEKDETIPIMGVTSKHTADTINGKKALQMLKKKESRLTNYSLEEVADPQLKKNLKEFEERQLKLQFRMGVLYCKNGQLTEDEMYSNVDSCPEFNDFLETLGPTVDLQDWTKFRGGLDVKGGTTGTKSVFAEIHNYQIMFHVSTMLPFQPDDAQRVERKRHLGNDVVLVIFVETKPDDPIAQFDPSIIKSQFNHVFIVVQVDHSQPQSEVVNFKISISCKEGVIPFGPDFPQSYSFPKGDRFRQFLLTKLINAERAALHAPIFAQKIKRTRKEALQMLYNQWVIDIA